MGEREYGQRHECDYEQVELDSFDSCDSFDSGTDDEVIHCHFVYFSWILILDMGKRVLRMHA